MYRTMLFFLGAAALGLAACGTPPADETSEAAKLSGPRPEGAISVRSLDIPPLPQPGLRRRRVNR